MARPAIVVECDGVRTRGPVRAASELRAQTPEPPPARVHPKQPGPSLRPAIRRPVVVLEARGDPPTARAPRHAIDRFLAPVDTCQGTAVRLPRPHRPTQPRVVPPAARLPRGTDDEAQAVRGPGQPTDRRGCERDVRDPARPG